MYLMYGLQTKKLTRDLGGCHYGKEPLERPKLQLSPSEDLYPSDIATAIVIKGIETRNIGLLSNISYEAIMRIRNSVDVSDPALRAVYLLPFQFAIEASPKCVMRSYKKVMPEHVSQSKKLVNDTFWAE
ncbi:hypothetical protein KL929_001915 [Ogataea haglerorum]|nr:hypothetical protein KL929_001915 [Ogataea haglerorum]